MGYPASDPASAGRRRPHPVRLTVLDFQVPYTRPETLGFNLRCLPSKRESHGRKLGRR